MPQIVKELVGLLALVGAAALAVGSYSVLVAL